MRKPLAGHLSAAQRQRMVWAFQALGWFFIIMIIGGVVVRVTNSVARVNDPFKGDAIQNPAFPSLTYGIQVFGWWDSGFFGYQLDSVSILRFNTIKQSFAWRDLEPIQGVWAFAESDRIMGEAESRSLKVVARLGQIPAWAAEDSDFLSTEEKDAPPRSLDEWSNYCTTIATRYKGRIMAYQVWNEPNLTREWGSLPPNAADYVTVLGVCSNAIRQADPQAKIISAGLAPTGTNDPNVATPDDVYLDAMYRAGFQQYVDVVGVHAPGYSAPSYGPDDAEREGRGRWFSFRRVEDLRKIMIAHGDEARQMAILEMGYTTDPIHPDYAWFAVTEEQRAEYMVEAFTYMKDHWRPWIGLVSVIYMQNPLWSRDTEEYWWSISTLDRFHTEAYMALAQMPKYCDDTVLEAWEPNAKEEDYLDDLNACP